MESTPIDRGLTDAICGAFDLRAPHRFAEVYKEIAPLRAKIEEQRRIVQWLQQAFPEPKAYRRDSSFPSGRALHNQLSILEGFNCPDTYSKIEEAYQRGANSDYDWVIEQEKIYKDTIAELTAIEKEFGFLYVFQHDSSREYIDHNGTAPPVTGWKASTIVTKTRSSIVLTDDEKALEIDFGEFFLLIQPHGPPICPATYEAYAIALNPKTSSKDDGYTHPNVSGAQVCMGDGNATFSQAVAAGRFFDAFCMINAVLFNNFSENPYATLSTWSSQFECKDCMESFSTFDQGKMCSRCDRMSCNDCTGQCKECDRYLCYEHALHCDVGNTHCTLRDRDTLCVECVADHEEECSRLAMERSKASEANGSFGANGQTPEEKEESKNAQENQMYEFAKAASEGTPSADIELNDEALAESF